MTNLFCAGKVVAERKPSGCVFIANPGYNLPTMADDDMSRLDLKFQDICAPPLNPDESMQIMRELEKFQRFFHQKPEDLESILFACQAGRSRSVTLALIWLKLDLKEIPFDFLWDWVTRRAAYVQPNPYLIELANSVFSWKINSERISQYTAKSSISGGEPFLEINRTELIKHYESS